MNLGSHFPHGTRELRGSVIVSTMSSLSSQSESTGLVVYTSNVSVHPARAHELKKKFNY